MWIQNSMHELGQYIMQVPTLFSDNTSDTYVCANPVSYSKMKLVALDQHDIYALKSNGYIHTRGIKILDQIVY